MNWFDKNILRKTGPDEPVEGPQNLSDDEEWPVKAKIKVYEHSYRAWSYYVTVFGPNGETASAKHDPRRDDLLYSQSVAEQQALKDARRMAINLRIKHKPTVVTFEVNL